MPKTKEESLVRIKILRMRIRRFSGRRGILPSRAHSDQECKQESEIKPPCHIYFKYLIPSLLVVVALKYQGISEDPSKTHPLQTWSFIIAIFIYSIILFTMKQSQNQSAKFLQFLGFAALASRVLSSLSLLSLLLPHFSGLVLLLTSWALFVLISALPMLQSTGNWLLTGIKPFLDTLICLARNLFKGWNFSHKQPSQVTGPPV